MTRKTFSEKNFNRGKGMIRFVWKVEKEGNGEKETIGVEVDDEKKE
jgi:hypothetical protein